MLDHARYFAIWNRRDSDYGIPEHFALDLSTYKLEASR